MKNLREEFLQLFDETSPNKFSSLPKKTINNLLTLTNYVTEILVYLSFKG